MFIKVKLNVNFNVGKWKKLGKCDKWHLKNCKYQKQQIEVDKMGEAEDFASKKSKGSWKKVNEWRGWKTVTADNIGGLTNKEDISELFAKKFSSINCATGGSSPLAHAGDRGLIASFLNGDVRVAISRRKEGIGFYGVLEACINTWKTLLKLISSIFVFYVLFTDFYCSNLWKESYNRRKK